MTHECGLCVSTHQQKRQRYVLIKGPNLFVFASAVSSSPKYALDVVHKKVTLHPQVGHTQLVTFESGLGDVDYKFLFDLRESSDAAKNFTQALKEQIAAGETDEVKTVREWTGLMQNFTLCAWLLKFPCFTVLT